MKYNQYKYLKKKRDIRLVHKFYDDLLDNVEKGTLKIAKKLHEAGTDDTEIFRYLRNVQGLEYRDAVAVIKEINK
jgi:hypothetical protein